MEDFDNFQEFDNIKEDEGSISEPKTHVMPLTRVINRCHLVQELLTIHTQEDPYMIQLLGRQRYIDIISNAHIRWVARVCSSFKFCSSLLFYHFVCVGLLLLVVLCVCICTFYCLYSFI